MNTEDKLYIESLNGFLNAVAIMKSPERNIFYTVRIVENTSLQTDIKDIIYTDEGEVEIINQKPRNTDLKWLFNLFKDELSTLDEKASCQLCDNIWYYFENILEELSLTGAVEYFAFGKLIDQEIDFYCEFNEKLFVLEVDNDLMIINFTYRNGSIRSLKEVLQNKTES